MNKEAYIKEFLNALIKDLYEDFNSCDILLEAGVGKGDFSIFFKNCYPHKKIIVVDRNLDFFKKRINKYNVLGFDLIERDVLKTGIPSESVDIVVAYNFLHHLSSFEMDKFLKEMYRISKNKIVIIDRTLDILDRDIENYLKLHEFEASIDREKNKKPERFFSLDEIKKILNKNKWICIFEKIYLNSCYTLNKKEKDEYLSHIKNQIQSLPHLKREFFLKNFAELRSELTNLRLKLPPFFCIVAKKIQVTPLFIPVRLSKITTRIESPDQAILYEKSKGMFLLNRIGLIIWNLCDGKRNIKEIAEIMYHRIPNPPTYQKLLTDITSFLIQLFERGLIEFKRK